MKFPHPILGKAKYFFAVVTLSLLFGLVLKIPFFGSLNDLLLDRVTLRENPREDIVIIGIDDRSLHELGAWPWDRGVFAKVIRNLTSVSIKSIGFDILFLEPRAGDEDMLQALSKNPTYIILGSKIQREKEGTKIYEPVFYGSQSGYVNLLTDGDGKIRKSSLNQPIDGKCEPSLTAKIGHYTNPFCNPNPLRFIYTNNNFKYLSFIDVYQNNYDKNLIENSNILVGVTATDIKTNVSDNFIDISGKQIPGVYIHANILNSVLNKTFIRDIAWMQSLLVLIIFVSCPLTVLSLRRTRGGSLVFFLATMALLNVGGLVFLEINYYPPVLQANLLTIATFLMGFGVNYLLVKKERQFIKKAFDQYINPQLLNKMLDQPNLLKLGGEKKEMTVLFSDIRGFTSFSEKLKPEEIVRILNIYLGEMTQIILDNYGTVDKYVGDEIVAFWNAPLSDKNHRDNAISTVIKMQETLSQLNSKHFRSNPLKVGIGLNTGEMFVGNIGSDKRFDYTIIGDDVNLGSRVEQLTKKYGIGCLMTEEVVKGTSLNKNKFRLVDEVAVKGRTNSVKIYDMTSDNVKSSYESAFALYQQKNLEPALKIFKKLAEENKDGPSKLMCERIEKGLDKDFDGVWHWDEK